MKRLTFASSLLLCSGLFGCISDKDVGLETESGDESSSESSASASMSGTESESDSLGDTETLSGTGSESDSISGTASESDSESTTGLDTESGTTSLESSGGFDTEQFDAQSLCENSGGTWDDTTCGHYFCGTPNDCAAVIPGCNCGPDANFVEETGCVESPKCAPFEFGCGPDDTCEGPFQYCDILIPGVKGAETQYDCLATPKTCTADYTCECFADAGDFEGECMEGKDGGVTITFAAP